MDYFCQTNFMSLIFILNHTEINRNHWDGIKGRKSIWKPRHSLKMFCSNVEYMQIVVNGLKLAQPPVWSFLKVVGKCWIPELAAFLHCGRLACPHIDSKIQSPPTVTQLLSKAPLSAEPAVLDAVEIVNPSVCSGAGSKSWSVHVPAQQGRLVGSLWAWEIGRCELHFKKRRRWRHQLCDVTLCLCWIKSRT